MSNNLKHVYKEEIQIAGFLLNPSSFITDVKCLIREQKGINDDDV